jgi:hypothetical protein
MAVRLGNTNESDAPKVKAKADKPKAQGTKKKTAKEK